MTSLPGGPLPPRSPSLQKEQSCWLILFTSFTTLSILQYSQRAMMKLTFLNSSEHVLPQNRSTSPCGHTATRRSHIEGEFAAL